MKDSRLPYSREVCLPQNALPSILQIADDSKLAGHFRFARTCVLNQQFSLEKQAAGCEEIYLWVYELSALQSI